MLTGKRLILHATKTVKGQPCTHNGYIGVRSVMWVTYASVRQTKNEGTTEC